MAGGRIDAGELAVKVQVHEWATSTNVRFGPFQFFLYTKQLFRNGKPLPLEWRLMSILFALATQRGGIVSRQALCQELWPKETHVDFENCLSVAVSKLRRELGDPASRSRYIETVHGQGYRLLGVTLPNGRSNIGYPAPPRGIRPRFISGPAAASMWR